MPLPPGALSSTTSGAGTCHTLPIHHCTRWTCTSLIQIQPPKLGWFFQSNYWKNFFSGHFERVSTASQCCKIQNSSSSSYYVRFFRGIFGVKDLATWSLLVLEVTGDWKVMRFCLPCIQVLCCGIGGGCDSSLGVKGERSVWRGEESVR